MRFLELRRGRSRLEVWAAALMPLIGATLACGTGGGNDFVVRDSAGVAVAESRAPAWPVGRGWRVDSLPVLTIPSWSSPTERDSTHFSDATRLDDGTIVVANNATGELGFFDRRGGLLRLAGGLGREPGRSESLRFVWAIGDSLWAFDGIGRWNVYSLDGEPLLSLYLEPMGAPWGWVEPLGRAFLAIRPATGSGWPPPEVSGVRRTPVALLRYTRTGRRNDTLLVVPSDEEYLLRDGDGIHHIRHPFSRRTVMHGGAGGLYVGLAEAMEIHVHAEDGRLRRIIRIPGFDLRLADAEWEELVQVYDARLGGNAQGRTPLNALTKPEAKPAYSDFLEDPLGYLWVAGPHEGTRPGEGRYIARRWQILDPEGRWLGEVTTPERLRVLEIGPDYLLGLTVAAGGSRVQLHRLERDPER